MCMIRVQKALLHLSLLACHTGQNIDSSPGHRSRLFALRRPCEMHKLGSDVGITCGAPQHPVLGCISVCNTDLDWTPVFGTVMSVARCLPHLLEGGALSQAQVRMSHGSQLLCVAQQQQGCMGMDCMFHRSPCYMANDFRPSARSLLL
jgi:hypothetical protein